MVRGTVEVVVRRLATRLAPLLVLRAGATCCVSVSGGGADGLSSLRKQLAVKPPEGSMPVLLVTTANIPLGRQDVCSLAESRRIQLRRSQFDS
jgi:hypothetical protein